LEVVLAPGVVLILGIPISFLFSLPAENLTPPYSGHGVHYPHVQKCTRICLDDTFLDLISGILFDRLLPYEEGAISVGHGNQYIADRSLTETDKSGLDGVFDRQVNATAATDEGRIESHLVLLGFDQAADRADQF
jgi:hypothetical protein